MNRRRFLSAATTAVATPPFDFPLTLVTGDNGQIGVDLYNYAWNIVGNDSTKSIDFDENQIIFYYNNIKYSIIQMWKLQDMVGCTVSPANTILLNAHLHNTGLLSYTLEP